MNIRDRLPAILQKPEYDFLGTNPHLGENIVLLTYGGSKAYGTDTPESDTDIRGIAVETRREILTGHGFDQVIDEKTDTVIYSFRKIISLLANCNPNVIEILGCRPEHYFLISDIGERLLNNKSLFLSKRAYYSFGGYASAQLRRLDNKSVRTQDQARQEEHILASIMNAKNSFPEKYFPFPEDNIFLYTDTAVQEGMESEIFMDVRLHHYPLRDYKCMWSEMHNIVKDYAKIGKRNTKAIEHGKLGKHMMHLIRLYMMGYDILRYGEINTYRKNEHDLLMEIRNGAYLGEDGMPTKEFFDMVTYYEEQMKKAKEKSELPDTPDYEKIDDLKEEAAANILGLYDTEEIVV